MSYEKDIFDSAVKKQLQDDEIGFIRALMALGILHYYKYDRAISSHRAQCGQEEFFADGATLQGIADSFTDLQIADFYRFAEQQLEDYAWKKSTSRTNGARAPDDNFWNGVAQSIAGSFLYSLLIVFAFIIIKYSGGDILNTIKELFR